MSLDPRPTSARRRISEIMLPTRPIRRAADSVGQTRAALSALVQQFRTSLPDRPSASADDQDPAARFAAIYRENGWSEQELATQLKAVRLGKVTALIMSVVAAAGVMVSFAFLPMVALLLVVPAGGCVVILGIAQTLKFALYEAQIELRSLISARQLASREDFFRRLLK